MSKEKDEVIYVSFNQDQTYFAVATQKGFKIYRLDQEIELVIARDFGAGIGIIEMIHKTNIFALVGGGQTPRHPKNKLMIWDDCKKWFMQHRLNV
jgi:WD repeat-containing protein 45